MLLENKTSNLYENVYTALEELGLKPNEINLYVLSLTLGPSPISLLAKQLAISRPNVYKLIIGLEKHGLAEWGKKARFARTFMVSSPSAVVEKLREKQKKVQYLDHDLVAQIPQLLAQYHQGSIKTKVKIFEGGEQFVKLFFQILEEEKSETLFCGSAKDFIGFISWAEEMRWIKERLRKNIKIRALLFPSDEASALKAKDNLELREIRFLQDIASFETGFQLFANKVVFWQPKAPIAILMEDEFIVKMMRNIFNGLWDKSE